MCTYGNRRRAAVRLPPNRIARLAEELGLSQPAVHTHVTDMVDSELLRGAKEWEKKHPAENYYEANFPIVRSADRRVFEAICDKMAQEVADIFQSRQRE